MAIEILLRTLREVKPDIRVAEIADFPGYAVDSDGDVWSFKQRNEWRKLSPHLDRHGYPTATLDYKARGVHTLVLRAFVGPCPPGHEASHFPDPTRTNNKLSNLRWEPRAKNNHNRREHLTMPRGPQNGQSKLSANDVIAIRTRIASSKETIKTVAAPYGISPGQARRIACRQMWKEIPDLSSEQWRAVSDLFREVYSHVAELESALESGALQQADDKAVTRANRNSRIRAALEKWTGPLRAPTQGATA